MHRRKASAGYIVVVVVYSAPNLALQLPPRGACGHSTAAGATARAASVAYPFVVATRHPASVADSQDSNLKSSTGRRKALVSSAELRYGSSKTAQWLAMEVRGIVMPIMVPSHAPGPVPWLFVRGALAMA